MSVVHYPALSYITDYDIYLFNQGSHFTLYEKMGAHPMTVDREEGVHFAVWAPNADSVSVIGDFNDWDEESHPLAPVESSGIWAGFIPGVGTGEVYKYRIHSQFGDYRAEKADPFGFYSEVPPKSGSVVWDLDYEWGDGNWMECRGACNGREAPISIYELHIGSWRRAPHEEDRPLTYRELAPQLAEHMLHMGFTHVEFLPVMEHPFNGSWGYQITGYFSPTSRFGTPQDLMYLIDYLHQRGLGVILDWVPSHFPTDGHGLGFFDGTHLYEHADSRRGFHPDWRSHIFNYGRNEVAAFLINSALYWLEIFHADGLRVDGVASMLYLDYSRKEGEWLPNEEGGRENIEAISFLRRLNTEVYRRFPDVQTIAEESTAWPMVSRPVDTGGLGFGMKWDMGWMHDSLAYMKKDPVHRKFHHNLLTFRMLYAYNENFVLPLSHDEVVHGKSSLLGKMPGEGGRKFANLRALYGLMFAQPGKKLLFMGGEFGQWREWNHDGALDWDLAQEPLRAGLMKWVRDLNALYHNERALFRRDYDPSGFRWVAADASEDSVLGFVRVATEDEPLLLVAANLTPVPRMHYRMGVPADGDWIEVLNSDSEIYGGSGMGNPDGCLAAAAPLNDQPYSIEITLPPLSVVYLRETH